MAVEFKLLGTGAGPGTPSFHCDCIACREAREKPRLSRTRSGAVITTGKETILIDASPDLRTQLVREQIRTLDYVFISHWHYDHFGGLGELEYYIKLSRQNPLTLYLPPEDVESFTAAYPFLTEVLNVLPWKFERDYWFEGLKLTLLPARHGVQTAGFVLQGEKTAAYFTDTAPLPFEVMQKLMGVDFMICDATFNGGNWYPNSHMSVEEAIELGKKVRAETTVLTHLAMHYSTPVTVEMLEKELKAHPRVRLAYDGMVIKL